MLTKPCLRPAPVERISELGKCLLSLLQIKENNTGVKQRFPQIPNQGKFLGNGETKAGRCKGCCQAVSNLSLHFFQVQRLRH